MRIRILGSAAGGGLPQWNCRCPNCRAARGGSTEVRRRTQSSVAISADGQAWFLLNVSADVRQQLLSFDRLWPPEAERRGTTIAGCVLTDAEIDHTSGLLQLREGSEFGIFSTATVHGWLSDYLPIEPVLAGFANRPWTDLPLEERFELSLPSGQDSGLRVRAFEIGDDRPRYVPADVDTVAGSVIGLHIQDTASGGMLLYAPGVSIINESLVRSANEADCVLIDGTFWTDDEPSRMGIADRTATQMGHLPVDGPDGTLLWLGDLSARYRAYIHINNTNPMLNDRGPERRRVQDQGVDVSADGEEFEV